MGAINRAGAMFQHVSEINRSLSHHRPGWMENFLAWWIKCPQMCYDEN